MNRFKTLALTAGTSALLLIFFVSAGICWQSPATFPVPAGGPMAAPCPPPACGPVPPPVYGPVPPPFIMGPCAPREPCLKLGIEIGGRAFYSTNYLVLHQDDGPQLDFIRDLNLSRNTLLGEIYGGLRLPPSLAFTYTYRFSRTDDGWGTLTRNLQVDRTLFTAGTPVTVRVIPSLHRWELEWFPLVGCNYRIGPYLNWDLYVSQFRISDGAVSETEDLTEFYMGAGITAEYAPENVVFLRAKSAVTFLQDSLGYYLDAEARYSPESNPGDSGNLLGGLRPFLGLGYKYRTVHMDRTENETVQFSTHGPYAELGFVF